MHKAITTSFGAIVLTMISIGTAQAVTVDGITVNIYNPGTSGIASIDLAVATDTNGHKTLTIQETWTSIATSYLAISGLTHSKNYTVIKEIINNTGVEWTSLANELLDPATGFDNDSGDGTANFPVPTGYSASSGDGLSFAQSPTGTSVPRISSIFDLVIAQESAAIGRDFLDYINTTGPLFSIGATETVQFGLLDYNPAGNQTFLLAGRPNERSIPEPATLVLMLMGLGLAGMGIGRRQHKKQS